MTDVNESINSDEGVVADAGNEGMTESKTYSEAEVMQLLQQETDRRVSAALKKQEHKLNQRLAEADKLRNMDEEQRKEYEFEQKMREFENEKREFELNRNKLEAAKVLSNRNLPVAFVDYVAAETAEDTMENITTFEKLFKAAVNDAVSMKIASPTPKSGTAQTGLTKEVFDKMSAAEQMDLYRSNPELYKQMTS